MTYCVAIKVDAGLIFCSDSRTNAGVDQVSTYSKMYHFGIEGDRQIVINSAGNLATTQSVIAKIRKDIKDGADISLATLDSIHDAADYVGEISVTIQEKHAQHNSNVSFEASFLLGGQINGDSPAVMLIYPQGNHITTSKQTPYLQIGESKYGKPILDRILKPETGLDTAALCALVSMDSTMKSNLTVGPPIELMTYATNSGYMKHSVFEADNQYLRELTKSWDCLIVEAFLQLPPPPQN
ncbi:peptidase [Cellvibrio fibrivorans]|uniref:Proteasome-type protease n=1 Tax=Cellvibrio fibrivorans TaxID=126350 RepID=A0ABU1V3F1_9GAMM|nr:peptidase [Cellvibrio fibrivorans]MDR7091977.1 putative proteasome-type protease [Cellvibrio fibrivorans]